MVVSGGFAKIWYRGPLSASLVVVTGFALKLPTGDHYLIGRHIKKCSPKSMRKLTQLWRFPVKSLAGARQARLPVGPRGPDRDRHWMVVDAEGRFLTQRQLPAMSQLRAELQGTTLVLRAADGASLAVAAGGGEPMTVQVWKDRVAAVAPDPAADAWLSDRLGQVCRLVRQPDDGVRPVDPTYARTGDQVDFADGFPFLLISQASLDDLNGRLAEPVDVRRFRPNLVVDGCEPYEEDRWRRIRIGGLSFRVVKPCSRCPIPTIDPDTGERGAEPLRTLMGYRRRDNKVYFGQNLIHDGSGELAEGMAVEVLEQGEPTV
jgi:uncharacterized protein YcbX